MVALYPDFYNDVFGPIMQPGSSSHMAAPCRMGYMCNSLLGEDVKEILVKLDTEGSFAGTFGLMNEDLGMLAGALGDLPDDERLFSTKSYCRNNGIKYEFDFCAMKESSHINAVKFILTGVSGKTSTLVANSTGGGMVETVLVNGYPYTGKGDTYVVLVFDKDRKLSFKELATQLAGKLDILEEGASDTDDKGILYWYKTPDDPSKDFLKEVVGDVDFAVMKPVLPVITRRDKKEQLFDTVTDWRRLAEEQGKGLYEIALDYQMAASGWTREQVIDYMKNVRAKMHRQTHAIYDEDVKPLETPYSGYHYKQWSEYIATGKRFSGNAINKAIYYALAASTTIPGVHIVPGPMGTGGGFVYSALCAVKEEFGYSDEDLLKGLFIAAGIGAICYTRTGPTGEVIGCTGECGVCCAMAAAGVAEMAGSTPEQVEAAASLALQTTVGWPCDPIPGGKMQPCLSRVITAVTMAITFAEFARSGRDPVLPFHEVVDVADKIGRGLSGDLLCTSRGGHCAAPTAQQCIQAFNEWHRQQ